MGCRGFSVFRAADSPECRGLPNDPIIQTMIRLDHVTKHYQGGGHVTALDDVCLSIDRAEMVSIVGPSGSGKSTLLQLMGALDRPTTGSVTIDGRPLTHMSDDQMTLVRRDKIGFIFQFFNLLPSLSCLENVALPLHLRGVPRKKAIERAAMLLEMVGLGDRVSHLPEQLSGGQKQRVAIARALSINPPILLGDEPTGNLDSRTSEEILHLMAELHKQLWTTIVIVTHDLTVARRCQRIITIKDGRVAADTGSPRPDPSVGTFAGTSSSPAPLA